MLRQLALIPHYLYSRSPRENLARLLEKIRKFLSGRAVELNSVIPEFHNRPVFKKLIRHRLGAVEPLLLLGKPQQTQFLASAYPESTGIRSCDWQWNPNLDPESATSATWILVCDVPLGARDWEAIQALKRDHPGRVLCIHELLLPFTALSTAQSALDYWDRTLEEITPYYLGERNLISDLCRMYSFAGKTVIELGPMEGRLTASMIHQGAKSVTCVEARPENAIKTMIAAYALGWTNMRLVMDDFHNADRSKYGEFDLAFALGVYYHSMAPFVLLNNLISLSRNIFVGGWCATDSHPRGPWETLQHAGSAYRVKRYVEGVRFTAGINRFGYYFRAEDLMRFFEERGFGIQQVPYGITGESVTGRFLCFLATRK